jgi:hypothetical protein
MRPDIGDVRDPDTVRLLNVKLALQMVGPYDYG